MNDAEKIAREIADDICGHTFSDPALPTWKKHIVKHIATLVQERDELESKQFVPGAWVCPKCNFTCFKNILYAQSGNVGHDTTSHFEICPNDMERMHRLSWEEHCEGMASQLENRIKDNIELRAQLEKAKEALLSAKHNVWAHRGGCNQCGSVIKIQCTCGMRDCANLIDATLAELSAKDSTERKGD